MDLFTLGLLQKNLSGNKGDIKSKNGESSYTITDAVDFPVLGLNLYGKSTQDGTPTPETPVDIVSVGDSGFDIVSKGGNNFVLISCRYIADDIITKQPDSATANVDDTITFEVNATGTGLTYQWQWSNDNGKTWRKSSSTKYYCNVICQESYNGMMYRCIVTDANGKSVTSNPAVIYIVADNCNVKTGSIVLPSALCGIPVESGGNYTDRNGQQWVCDEFVYNADGTGKIIKRCKKIYIESSNITSFVEHKTLGNYFYTNIKSINIDEQSSLIPISNAFEGIKFSERAQSDYLNKFRCFISTDGRIMLRNSVAENDKFPTLESMRNFVDSNDVYIVYQLAIPQEIELTAAEMTALRQLMTYSGTTNISNSDNAEMDVKYCINQVMADYYPIFAGQGTDVQPLVLFEGTDEGYSLADGFTGFSVYYTDTLPTEEERITISKICADDSTTESRYGYLISKIKSIDNSDYNYTDSAVISSNEMVDLTNYKTLCIDFYGLASYNTTSGEEKNRISNSAYFRIDRPDTLPQSHISYDWTGWDNMGMYYRNHNKYYFDVSQISGEHYLCFGIFHGNYSKYYLNGIKIYKMTLI